MLSCGTGARRGKKVIWTKLLISIVGTAMLTVPFSASAQDVPDALSVEWEGKKPCEKLYEDDQIRILRCTFPPGSKHVRHQHPANFGYMLSGGKVVVENENGVQPEQELATDVTVLGAPVPWHEVTNSGDTTERFLVVEMKYKK
jgi:quercetin dioxygenase-like cupin family protein